MATRAKKIAASSPVVMALVTAPNATPANPVISSEAADALIAQMQAEQAATIAPDAVKMQQDAMAHVADVTYAAGRSRDEQIETLNIALGDNPSDQRIADVRFEVTVGRVLLRLDVGEYPVGCRSLEAKKDFIRTQMLSYAPHNAEKVKTGQLGRRTEAMDKALNIREYWSQLMAELGRGKAKTQKEKNKSKRATNENPARGEDKADDKTQDKTPTPTPTPVAESATDLPDSKSVDHAYCTNHIMTQASQLLAFCNKADYAKHMPTDFGMAVIRFHRDVTKAMVAYQERLKLANAKQ